MTVVVDELPQEVRDLVSQFKQGYRVERVRGGKLHVIRRGRTVQWKGKALEIHANGHHAEETEKQLRQTGVLKGSVPPSKQSGSEDSLRGIEIMRTRQQEATLARRQASIELRDRMKPWLRKIGADSPGVMWDIARYLHQTSNGVYPSPESALHALKNVLDGQGIQDESRAMVDTLSRRFEEDPEPLALYIDIAREARGLDSVEVATGGKEWPFSMKLVDISACFADLASDDNPTGYQRPVPPPFVRELVLRYDERKVGSIQVSARADERFAILDGQTRHRASEIVGKERIWAAVYEGMSLADEAKFFWDVNHDRKNVHPFYGFRARLLSGEQKIIEINRIVEAAGLRVSPNTDSTHGGIAAVASLEFVYDLKSDVREDNLTPALEPLGSIWKGLQRSVDSELIRGLGRFYAVYSDEEIGDPERFWDMLRAQTPLTLINRAREQVFTTGGSTIGSKSSGMPMARALVEVHNAGLGRGQRLDASRLGRYVR